MRRIVTSRRFERRLGAFVRKHPELSTEIQRAIQALAVQDIPPSSLKVHKLAGTFQGMFSARIGLEYRLTFLRDKEQLSLINIGTHDDVYR